jgi:hypothetical protein
MGLVIGLAFFCYKQIAPMEPSMPRLKPNKSIVFAAGGIHLFAEATRKQ